ncbi:unnamed protein product [Meloidogyne enterolobii]|uniref:Uncharacterized protein n=1 Tax=Meloidogyne enterolobii TaxID=390850 RepID=A0ACB0YL64_MELEN
MIIFGRNLFVKNPIKSIHFDNPIIIFNYSFCILLFLILERLSSNSRHFL